MAALRAQALRSPIPRSCKAAAVRPCHRLNIELDLQSLFGLHVTWCAQLHSLAETPQSPRTPAFGLDIRERYWSAKIDDISL